MSATMSVAVGRGCVPKGCYMGCPLRPEGGHSYSSENKQRWGPIEGVRPAYFQS